MAFLVVNKFSYPTGAPDANDVYPGVSSTWGDDGAGVLNNGTIAFPTAAGGAGQVLTDVGGTGVLTFADAPSTPPSGILGSVQLSDGAGGFTSDQPSFNYNSTTKRLGVGKVATTSLDVLEDSIDTNALFENVSGADFGDEAASAIGLKMLHRCTIDMVQGFGVKQDYFIEDDTSGELLAGSAGFERESTDALRRYVVKGGSNGTEELFHVTSGRAFTVEKGLRNGFGIAAYGTVPGDALAWNINNAGTSGFFSNAGSGIGLRVLANSGNILSLEDSSQAVQASVSSVGLVTFNAAANATGDFEVKAQTSGTATYTDVSAKQMVIGSNTSFVNADLMLDNGGYLGLKETTTPTATASYAKVYTKNDNKLYFQDGAGTESALAPFVGVGGNGDVTFITNGKLGSSNALNFSSGKLTVNSTNASNGDFQVKGDLVDSLIHTDADNNRIGFGKFPTTFQYEFTSSTGITLFERETTSTNGNFQPFILRHRTTGNMTTGFGSGIIFAVEDATSGSTAIGQFQVNRGSSDANGEIKILAGVGGGVSVFEIDENSKYTLNPSASSTGDFEVLAETTGTATYTDVSNKRFAVGHASPTGVIHAISSDVTKLDRTTSNTSIANSVLQMQAISSGDMADGFGPSTFWSIQDNAGTERFIGEMGFIRDGADTEGEFFVKGGTNATDNLLNIDSSANVTLYGTVNPLSVTGTTSSGFERTSSDTNNMREVFDVQHTTSANEVDGFGTAIRFIGEDSGGVGNILGKVGFVRDGADDFGSLIVRGGQDGDVQLIRADEVSGSTEIFLNLPTSAGTTGSLWNDSGTVKVA